MKTSKTLLLFSLAAALLGPAFASEPKLDPKRIINESNSFLKEREPEMTEEEYALYQKVVTMLASNPSFAVKLLEAMSSDKEAAQPGVPVHPRQRLLRRRGERQGGGSTTGAR
jgi:DNA replication initiation complex subunit (GINS family)